MRENMTNKKTEREGKTMLVNKGGQVVKKGTYWNPSDGHRVDLKEAGELPGGSGTTCGPIAPTASTAIGR